MPAVNDEGLKEDMVKELARSMNGQFDRGTEAQYISECSVVLCTQYNDSTSDSVDPGALFPVSD
jgi:hypothetical protein